MSNRLKRSGKNVDNGIDLSNVARAGTIPMAAEARRFPARFKEKP
jgi:hypothetical protein